MEQNDRSAVGRQRYGDGRRPVALVRRRIVALRCWSSALTISACFSGSNTRSTSTIQSHWTAQGNGRSVLKSRKLRQTDTKV